jgi:hypothetical protein
MGYIPPKPPAPSLRRMPAECVSCGAPLASWVCLWCLRDNSRSNEPERYLSDALREQYLEVTALSDKERKWIKR